MHTSPRVEHLSNDGYCMNHHHQYSQVKSSTVVGQRDRVAIIIRALLQTISSLQPYAGYGDLIGVRNQLSES